MKIVTRDDFLEHLGKAGAKRYRRMADDRMRWRKGEVQGETRAYINHGRWIADCPCCPSAQLVQPGDTEFFCIDANCDMMANGGHPAKLIWPDEREQIEAVLLMRPALNRNWQPHETLDDLKRENAEHIQPADLMHNNIDENRSVAAV